jgi:hypothetical protein
MYTYISYTYIHMRALIYIHKNSYIPEIRPLIEFTGLLKSIRLSTDLHRSADSPYSNVQNPKAYNVIYIYHICIYMYIYTCIYIYHIYVYICIYTHVYIYHLLRGLWVKGVGATIRWEGDLHRSADSLYSNIQHPKAYNVIYIYIYVYICIYTHVYIYIIYMYIYVYVHMYIYISYICIYVYIHMYIYIIC